MRTSINLQYKINAFSCNYEYFSCSIKNQVELSTETTCAGVWAGSKEQENIFTAKFECSRAKCRRSAEHGRSQDELC